MRKIILLISLVILNSCSEKQHEDKMNGTENQIDLKNQLVITATKDTLENGFWSYEDENGKLVKQGNYDSGFKVGIWKYIIDNEKRLVEWLIFNDKNIKFNYPKNLKLEESAEYPALFIGDIVDSSRYTYLALLSYDLKKMNSSVHDYIFQVNQSFVSDSSKIIIGKKFRRYLFKNIELFVINIQLEQYNEIYNIMSQVFVVNGRLYDFTYRDYPLGMSKYNLEIFRDIIYSFEADNIDVFTYSTGKYFQEEDLVFE